MAVTLVIGSQWGDEGKGKVVDLLSAEAEVVARYQGGANAGHTIRWQDETYVLHLLPSGIFRRGVTCVIGNGVVIDPAALMEEINTLSGCGFEIEGRLLISHKAHLIMPYHKAIERARESARDAGAIGTTGRGIGPAYVDKFARSGVRVVDLLDRDLLARKLKASIEEKNAILKGVYGAELMNVGRIIEEYVEFDRKIDPYVTDTTHYLNRAIREGKEIVAEGAQGALLDVDFGTYPFVTSSHPTAGGACTGLGIPPISVSRVVGVVKAYCTRVGNGPLPTEEGGEVGAHLQTVGAEVGATTGRRRRCGWLDLVALRYTSAINGFTDLAVTKLDVLSGVKSLQLCTRYRYDGHERTRFPSEPAALGRADPIYETVPGWEEDITGIRNIAELPAAARSYVNFLSDHVGVDVSMISTGPERSQTIMCAR